MLGIFQAMRGDVKLIENRSFGEGKSRFRSACERISSPLLGSVLYWVDVVIQQLVAIGGLPTGVGEAHLAKRTDPHLTRFAAQRETEDP